VSDQSGFGNGPKKPKMVRKEELRKKPSKLKKDDTTTWRATEYNNRQEGWFDGPDGCLNGCLVFVCCFILFVVLIAFCGGAGSGSF